MSFRLYPKTLMAACLVSLLTVGGAFPVWAQEKKLVGGLPPELIQELEFAGALTEMGLPDYAELIIKRIKDPRAKTMLEVVKLKNLVAMGKFEEVLAIIAKQPKQDSEEAWAMRLALADGYFAWGKYAEAQQQYEEFFKKYPKGPPPALNDFFIESAYKFAQMLILMGNEEGGLNAYKNIVLAKLEPHVKRQIQGETAELMLKLAETAPPEKQKTYFADIEKICNELFWKQDLWFGKAVVMMAQMKRLQGDVDGALKLVDDYRVQLEGIDTALKEQGEELMRLSPMANCRYLLGLIIHDRAQKMMAAGGNRDEIVKDLVGAIKHFVNVFIKYPGTSWAPDAGRRFKEIEAILKDTYNLNLKMNVSDEDWKSVEKYQFQNARAMFKQNQFAQAAEAYVEVLTLFPEVEMSIVSLGELATCYIETNNFQYADLTCRYLAERFSRNSTFQSDAGNQLLRIAESYEERQMPERKDALYDLFFEHFTQHPLAAPMLFRFGEIKLREENYASAQQYYTRIIQEYTNSPLYYDAYSRIAHCYSKLGDSVAEIKTLTTYIEELEKKERPGHPLVMGKFLLASAYRRLDPRYIGNALKMFSDVITMLQKNPAAYFDNPDQKEANAGIMEGAMFYRALSFADLKEPEDRVDGFRRQAIKDLEALVKQFPKSRFAPAALNRVGTIWTMLGDPEAARTALRKLQKEYPDSPEAKNALFLLAKSLLDLGMRTQAIPVFKEMFEAKGSYTASQILMAGNELLASKEYDIAIDAFQQVRASSADSPGLLQSAILGLGQALVEQGKHELGITALEELMTKYPNSGHVVEASFTLARAYSQVAGVEQAANKRFDLFNKAINALKKAKRHISRSGTEEQKASVDLELGRIQILKAQAAEGEQAKIYKGDAIATFQTLMMFGNMRDPGARQRIEEAYFLCIPLLMDTERWADAVKDCDTYVKLFPSGRWILEIRNWRGRANVRLISSGQSISEEPKTEAPPAEDGE